MKEKLSVVVPIFNAEKSLGRCLDSICNQTYKNLEILLVDDGSVDSSFLICKEFAKKDSRIFLLSQSNQGAGSARNLGMANASGEYITFVDSDDYLEQTAYEKVMKFIQDCDAAFFGFFESYDQQKINKMVSPKLEGVVSSDEAMYLCLLPFSFGTFVWNKIFRFNKIKDIKFDPAFYLAEDDEWITRVCKRLDKVVLLNIPLYYYIQKNNNFSHSWSPITKEWLSAIEAKIKVADYFDVGDNKYEISRAKVFNDLSFLKWNAYINNDKNGFLYVSKKLKPYKIFFYKSSEYGLNRKIKFTLLSMLILLRAPKVIIKILSEATIYKISNQLYE